MLAPREDITQQALLSLQAQIGGDIVGRKLYPIAPSLTPLLPLKPECELQRRWYVVQTHAQQERTVESEIKKLKLDAYCPLEPKIVRINAAKNRTMQKPILIGYVFAGYDRDHDRNRWELIFGVRGVMRMLPWPVGDREMERVRSIEMDRAGGRKHNMPKIEMRAGDLVRVKTGPFVDMLGFVDEVDEDKHEIRVDLDIFGRKVPLSLPAMDVSPV